VTVSELIRVVGKATLLHLPVLAQQPSFPALWGAVLAALGAAAAVGGPEAALADAAAAALQNLIIMLHEMVRWLAGARGGGVGGGRRVGGMYVGVWWACGGVGGCGGRVVRWLVGVC
jgi:hypothetical protein